MTDNPTRDEAAGPLSGIRVIDLTHMLSGPYCTWLLGALGADVIKVERPRSGDFTRIVEPMLEDESLYFLSVNRNKRSVTLNLKDPRGRDLLLRLAKDADVLVENNRAGVMDRLGLGKDDLAKVNPRLVYASISGFGQTGPYQHRAAFDVVVQALSGMMSVTGEAGGAPCRVGTSIGDIGASRGRRDAGLPARAAGKRHRTHAQHGRRTARSRQPPPADRAFSSLRHGGPPAGRLRRYP
jgi:CoA:oxalate CoA-transferase